MHGHRLKLGKLSIDSLTFAQALDAIERLVDAGQGGSVFTPNIDHVVNVESNAEFEAAYREASLSLVDGTPLLWASKLLGAPLPEKVSGSDLVWPLMERAGARGHRVYLLGGADGVAEKTAHIFSEQLRVNVVGFDAPMIRLDADASAIIDRIRAAAPQLLLVALGSPKQELFIHRHRARLAPAVSLAIGASLDFIAGVVKRSPKWMSAAGLEWLYRLTQDPRRLWRRYLINDPKFAAILLRELGRPRAERLIQR